MGVESSVNQAVIELWNSCNKDELTSPYCPALYPSLVPSSVLYLGLNPSHNKTAYKSKFTYDPNVYSFKNKVSVKQKEAIIHNEAIMRGLKKGKDGKEKPYVYYRTLQKFHKKLSLPGNPEMESVDLFFKRQTKQVDFKKNLHKHSEFYLKQLQLSFELIQKLKPKMIVVLNTFASKSLIDLSRQGDRLVIDKVGKNKGYSFSSSRLTIARNQKIQINDDGDIPIIFSGMLSGQRALDDFSKIRLKEEIRKVWKKEIQKNKR